VRLPRTSILLGKPTTSNKGSNHGQDAPHRTDRPRPGSGREVFESAFDLKRAGNARRGVYLSDGTINIALLKQEGNEKVGLYHFGMWVDDLDASEKKVLDAGGTYLEGRPTSPNSYYEAKYRDPLGIVFDLTHNGWIGATKDVVAKS